MDFPTLRARLAAEADRLHTAAAQAGPAAAVPTCPGWTVADLLDHVTDTYDHKLAAMRQLHAPAGDYRRHRTGTPAEQYRAAVADLQAAFDAREPDDLAYTWYGPDQTVGFWIRRMAHETLVHRADAELAAKTTISPIDPDLAHDGIDEMLHVILAWGSRARREQLGATLDRHQGLTVALDTGAHTWTLRVTDGAITVEPGNAATAAPVTVGADPATLMLWLWRRAPADAPTVTGDTDAARALYDLLGAFSG